ncbi:hypothetical protein INR49_016305 [Caranx melampygus]|nr:hypothetical protein INR49_016305 [Caranx melampygus]
MEEHEKVPKSSMIEPLVVRCRNSTFRSDGDGDSDFSSACDQQDTKTRYYDNLVHGQYYIYMFNLNSKDEFLRTHLQLPESITPTRLSKETLSREITLQPPLHPVLELEIFGLCYHCASDLATCAASVELLRTFSAAKETCVECNLQLSAFPEEQSLESLSTVRDKHIASLAYSLHPFVFLQQSIDTIRLWQGQHTPGTREEEEEETAVEERSQLEMMQELASDFDELKLLFPNLAQLSAIALTVPVSSVNCERDFSAMNRNFKSLPSCKMVGEHITDTEAAAAAAIVTWGMKEMKKKQTIVLLYLKVAAS